MLPERSAPDAPEGLRPMLRFHAVVCGEPSGRASSVYVSSFQLACIGLRSRPQCAGSR